MNNSTQKITAKIAQDAHSFEEIALREAEAGAAVIRDDYKSKADYAVAVIVNKSQNNVERIVARAESSAELVKRNGVLSAKSAILDDVFNIAIERIITSDDNQYIDLMVAVAIRAAEEMNTVESKNGTIIMNKNDAAKFGKRLVEQLSRKNKFTLSNEHANIRGGFILRCGDIDVNCSIESIVASIRPSLEPQVINTLFKI